MKKTRKNFKKIMISAINLSLLLSIPVMLLTVSVETEKVSGNTYTKKLSTSIISEIAVKNDNNNEIKEEKNVEEEQVDEEITENNNKAEIIKEKQPVKVEEKKEVVEKTQAVVNNNPTYTGTMSFYNASCTQCSGITATGIDVSDGRLYYNDRQYGNVRIVAAGTEIKKWSIVKIRNSSLGSEILAIVLDRGGDIGMGRKFIIDMLTNSSENKTGINKNITVEVIRNGK